MMILNHPKSPSPLLQTSCHAALYHVALLISLSNDNHDVYHVYYYHYELSYYIL